MNIEEMKILLAEANERIEAKRREANKVEFLKRARWIRMCQECCHEQFDTQPDPKKELPDSYRNRKCRRCHSEGLDYGRMAIPYYG